MHLRNLMVLAAGLNISNSGSSSSKL